MTNIDLSIIIVTYNTEEITLGCLESIKKSKTNFTYEVIVVDNNSSDNTVNEINLSYPSIKLITCKNNNGFSRGNNIGIKESSGKYIMLLNSDTILFEDSIDNLVNSIIENSYIISGPILLNKDLSLQRSWFNYPSPIKVFLRLTELYKIFYKLSSSYFFKLIFSINKPAFMIEGFDKNEIVNYLSFACIVFKKEVLDQIGLLDENLMFYHEDCEYGIRAKKNDISIIYNINSKIIHLGGTSSGAFSLFAFENDIKGLLHVYKKHYSNAELRKMKYAIYYALQIRILFWSLGIYRTLKKIGLYNKTDKKAIKKNENELFEKYKEIKKMVIKFN